MYVVIRDRSAGNETVGEMWQETKVFPDDATLDEVMRWGMSVPDGHEPCLWQDHSSRRITITMPDQS